MKLPLFLFVLISVGHFAHANEGEGSEVVSEIHSQVTTWKAFYAKNDSAEFDFSPGMMVNLESTNLNQLINGSLYIRNWTSTTGVDLYYADSAGQWHIPVDGGRSKFTVEQLHDLNMRVVWQNSSLQTTCDWACPEPKIVESVRIPDATLSMGAFALNSAFLKDNAKETLMSVVLFLKENPEFSVDVYGFTDSTGTSDYNQMLSEKRARAAAYFLISKGNIDSSRVNVEGFGEESPIATNKTLEGRKKNRRIEVYYKD